MNSCCSDTVLLLSDSSLLSISISCYSLGLFDVDVPGMFVVHSHVYVNSRPPYTQLQPCSYSLFKTAPSKALLSPHPGESPTAFLQNSEILTLIAL